MNRRAARGRCSGRATPEAVGTTKTTVNWKGQRERGTRNEERELEPEPSWKVRLGQKIELNNGCGTIYDDAWTIPGSRHVCLCVCVCVCVYLHLYVHDMRD